MPDVTTMSWFSFFTSLLFLHPSPAGLVTRKGMQQIQGVRLVETLRQNEGEEEAQAWNSDSLFGHYGRKEEPEPGRAALEVMCCEGGIPHAKNNRRQSDVYRELDFNVCIDSMQECALHRGSEKQQTPRELAAVIQEKVRMLRRDGSSGNPSDKCLSECFFFCLHSSSSADS
ncbi:hypothetical protein FQA47_006494 [Oryzias melastigma]|uniref:Uncharacterized protein n=1 Tax=Oryzias melastigma TaxID=30732 RepID=A0A834FMB0_ORYME|nr:hypothetical protein FQA47_006494 [Oryzias melastigma]